MNLLRVTVNLLYVTVNLQVSELQLHNLVECPSDVVETKALNLLQSKSRGLPNIREEEVGYAVWYLLKHGDCHDEEREYLVRWEDTNARNMWVIDKDMSDNLLYYWWTKTKGDLQSKMMDVSIVGSEARAYKRT